MPAFISALVAVCSGPAAAAALAIARACWKSSSCCFSGGRASSRPDRGHEVLAVRADRPCLLKRGNRACGIVAVAPASELTGRQRPRQLALGRGASERAAPSRDGARMLEVPFGKTDGDLLRHGARVLAVDRLEQLERELEIRIAVGSPARLRAKQMHVAGGLPQVEPVGVVARDRPQRRCLFVGRGAQQHRRLLRCGVVAEPYARSLQQRVDVKGHLLRRASPMQNAYARSAHGHSCGVRYSSPWQWTTTSNAAQSPIGALLLCAVGRTIRSASNPTGRRLMGLVDVVAVSGDLVGELVAELGPVSEQKRGTNVAAIGLLRGRTSGLNRSRGRRWHRYRSQRGYSATSRPGERDPAALRDSLDDDQQSWRGVRCHRDARLR
jgi:hypothetical protein